MMLAHFLRKHGVAYPTGAMVIEAQDPDGGNAGEFPLETIVINEGTDAAGNPTAALNIGETVTIEAGRLVSRDTIR